MADTPLPPNEGSVNIELEDLQELARINPLAWEQLLHIADNRRSREKIIGLTEQLQRLGKSSKELVDIKDEIIDLDKAFISELTKGKVGGKYPHA